MSYFTFGVNNDNKQLFNFKIIFHNEKKYNS